MRSALRLRYGKDRISVVISRADRQAEIGIDDVEAAIGGPVKHTFPSDYRLAVAALHRGQPLVAEGKSALATAFQNFARDLSGAKTAAAASASSKSPGFLGRLTGRR